MASGMIRLGGHHVEGSVEPSFLEHSMVCSLVFFSCVSPWSLVVPPKENGGLKLACYKKVAPADP